MSAVTRVAEFVQASIEAGASEVIASQEFDDGMGMGLAVLMRTDLQLLIERIEYARTPTTTAAPSAETGATP